MKISLTKLIAHCSLLTLNCSILTAQNQVEIKSNDGEFHVPATMVKKEVPHFYGTKVTNSAQVSEDTVTQKVSVVFTTIQGEAKKYSVKLSQKVEDLKLSGTGIKHWAVRKDAKKEEYFLDVFPEDKKAKSLSIQIDYTKERELRKSLVGLLTFSAQGKSGFAENVTVTSNVGISLGILEAANYSPVDIGNQKQKLSFVSTTGGKISLYANSASLYTKPISLSNASVVVSISPDNKSATIQLLGSLKVNEKKGAKIDLIQGKIAMLTQPLSDSLKASYQDTGSAFTYTLHAEEPGTYPVELSFASKIEEVSGWKNLNFQVLDGTVVPMVIRYQNSKTEETSVDFDEKRNVLPKYNLASTGFTAFLPADGHCDVAWRKAQTDTRSELFFTTKSIVDVSVGGGLVTQRNVIQTKILQGKLDKLTLSKVGQGDVTGVSGKHVSHWSVNSKGELEITLTGAYEALDKITIDTQHPLGTFPAKVHPAQFTPKDAVRHTGYIRAYNRGAVSLEVNKLKGMMQITPQQFPGYHRGQKFHQVYVYRFPSKQRDWHIEASQILPEISVRHLLVYGIGVSDRSINAEINLDVREAPLREWNVRIPEGYAVSSVSGSAVSDYVLSSQVVDGKKALKILFKQPIQGRHLMVLHLEKNSPAAEEVWTLPQIDYPGVEDVRGQIGIATALGWRVVTYKMNKLSEIPLAYFQKKSASIQQSYRQRKAKWNASVKIEKLKQSVQSDVFHLYTLKEGTIDCGVFLNYFIVGAPVREFRLSLPQGAENVSVIGQNVRSNKREGTHLIVTLEQPALGSANLFVKYEQTMKAEGGKLSLGQVTPLGVQSESGYIQVISPLQVKHDVADSSKGLISLEEAELPAEYRVLSSVPTIAAWQYAARPFNLDINVKWFAPKELVGQSIDFSTINTEITEGGRYSTTANFFVKTRGKQSLRMKLPAEAELYEVTANGSRINARIDGEDIILPLPAQQDLNNPVEVVVRYGPKAAVEGNIKLGVPSFSAPSVITNWKITSSDDQLLVPVGGNVTAKQPARGMTGFGWVSQNMNYLIGVMVLLAAGGLASNKVKSKMWKTIMGVCWLGLAGVASLYFAAKARHSVGSYDTSFEVVAPMVEADKEVMLEVQQLSHTEALVSPLGLALAGLGVALLVVCIFMPKLREMKVHALGLIVLSAGLLMQYGGAVPFFGLLALTALFLFIRHINFSLAAVRTSAAALIVIATFALTPKADAAVDSIDEVWNIEKERLTASATIKWKAKVGESEPLLFAPATLTSFDCETCRVVKQKVKGVDRWIVISEKEMEHEIKYTFERPMQNLAENAWTLVAARSMARTVTVTVDQPNWQTTSAQAVQETHTYAGGKSTSKLVLLPSKVLLDIKPAKIDPDLILAKFLAETTDLYLPAPGVLDGLHSVSIKPVQGRLRKVEINVPKGLMVGDVIGSAVNDWSYDPEKNTLNVQLTKPMTKDFAFMVATQRAVNALPAKLELKPLGVKNANQVIGMFALGFGNDAQPDTIKVSGMNAANIDDFSASLTAKAQTVRPGLNIHKAYRYSASDMASLKLQVAPVSPELRVVTDQVIFVGEERLTMNTSANVKVTRSGIFNLKFIIPKGFEVESVTGQELRDYIESEEEGQRFLTLHLKGKKLNTLNFKIAMTSVSPGDTSDWVVPQVVLDGAIRQSGNLTILPQQGIQVSAVSRKHVTQEDAREIRKKHAGALKFRLLQADSDLHIAIDKLDPWVTAELLQEVTLRDGQTRTRVGLSYEVQHAAIKELFIRIPSLAEEAENTVRVAGSHVKGIEKQEGDLWKISLRRGMIGKFKFDLEYQLAAERKEDKEEIIPVKLDGVKQVKHYIAVRANERLDMQAVSLGKGWRTADWKAVPESLYSLTNSSVPGMSYQLIEPQKNLTVQIRRHDMADTLKLRVTHSNMTTIFSKGGTALNHLVLNVDVVEKSSMSVTLPQGAKLFGVIVNEDTVPVVEENGVLKFNVTQGTSESSSVEVQVIYHNAGEAEGSKIALLAPKFNIPLEKINWNVILPEGVRLKSYAGDFKHIEQIQGSDSFSKSSYQSEVAAFQVEQQGRAANLMKQVDGYIKSGERAKATEILNQVARNRSVGADMNNDAQDLLKKNQIQHALMGLNTRRQRMYLDNKAEGNTFRANHALEEAASRNPLFNGDYNYDPNQVNDFMQGMSQDEQQALLEMATQIVDADLVTVSAPQAINVTIPEMGSVLQFERKLQLSQNDEIKLELVLEDDHKNSNSIAALILVIISAGAVAMCWRS